MKIVGYSKNLQKELKSVLWDDALEIEINDINQKILHYAKQSQILSRLKSESKLDSAIFMDKSDELNRNLDQLKSRKLILLKNQEDDSQIQKTDALIRIIETMTMSEEIDFDIFHKIVDKITVYPQKGIDYHLMNGLVLTESGGK